MLHSPSDLCAISNPMIHFKLPYEASPQPGRVLYVLKTPHPTPNKKVYNFIKRAHYFVFTTTILYKYLLLCLTGPKRSTILLKVPCFVQKTPPQVKVSGYGLVKRTANTIMNWLCILCNRMCHSLHINSI